MLSNGVGSKVPAEDRILATATRLFAQSGYNGISTREIAAAAQVNEITIYRHFPRKHDLYLSVLKSGLEQVHLRGDLLSDIERAEDGRTALAKTLELLTRALLEKPEVVRLLQYSALELGNDFDALARKHLGAFIDIIADYLDPWVRSGQLNGATAKEIVLTLTTIVMSYSSLKRVFFEEELDLDRMFHVTAQFYCS